jgi:hypothetical protein
MEDSNSERGVRQPIFASALGEAENVTTRVSQAHASARDTEFRSVTIQTGEQAKSIGKNVATILVDRIREISPIPVEVQSAGDKAQCARQTGDSLRNGRGRRAQGAGVVSELD